MTLEILSLLCEETRLHTERYDHLPDPWNKLFAATYCRIAFKLSAPPTLEWLNELLGSLEDSGPVDLAQGRTPYAIAAAARGDVLYLMTGQEMGKWLLTNPPPEKFVEALRKAVRYANRRTGDSERKMSEMEKQEEDFQARCALCKSAFDKKLSGS